MARKTPVLLLAAGTAIALLIPFASVALSTQTAGAAGSPPVAPTTIYDTTASPLIPVPSLGFEATSASEAGNLIQFSGSPSRLLSGVTVTMDSWGCESGSSTGSPLPCTTTSGSSFNEPITLNLYKPGASNSVGSLITSVTRTFSIAYRPSTDAVNCSSDPGAFDDNGTCAHGLPVNVTFPLGDTVVPSSVIWSVVYNTSDYGPHPYGHGTACANTSDGMGGTYDNCGYDSLNLGLDVANGPSVGSDPIPGTIWWNTSYAGFYCDSTLDGGSTVSGTFRLDSADDNGAPCWGDQSPYTTAPWDIPAAQFKALPEISVGSSNTTSSFGQSVTFTVTAPPSATHSVTVLDGASPVGSCTLSGGTCTVSKSNLTVGSHTITASYGGDGTFPAFTSAGISQSVAAIKPTAPTGPTAVPGNGSATVSWSPPSSNGGSAITSYRVTTTEGAQTCSTSGATTCTITGLTNGTPAKFSVTATNVAGTGPSAETTRSVTPATSGYHVYAVPPVIEQGGKVTISATGAQADSLLILSVARHGTKNVFADAYGAGSAKFTIGSSGKYAIAATNNNAIAHGTLYVARVTVPFGASHNAQIPVSARSAIPGSVLVVSTSSDGTFSVPVPSNGRVAIDLPKAHRGTLVVTVTDAGFELLQRTMTIS